MTRNEIEADRSGIRWRLAEFGKRVLRPKRKDRDLTLKQMADLIGVHVSNVSRVERGYATPKDVPTVWQYKKHYGLEDKLFSYWLHLIWGVPLKKEDASLDRLLRTIDLTIDARRKTPAPDRERGFAMSARMWTPKGRADKGDMSLLVPRERDPEQVLSSVLLIMENTDWPCYAIDTYCNLVACNAAVVELLDLRAAGLSLDNPQRRPSGFNMLHYVFSDRAVQYYPDFMGRNWEAYAYQNLLIWKSLTSRHMSAEWFDPKRYMALVNDLKEHKPFRQYWKKLLYVESDHSAANEEYVKMRSRRWGNLVFSSTPMPMPTRVGPLYINFYVPETPETREAFAQIVIRTGNSVRRIGPWPEKTVF